jgi:hypothetical protein
MTSDVRKKLEFYHDKMEFLAEAVEQEKEAARKVAVQSIESIVPHHCGDHSLCVVSQCLFLKLRKEIKANSIFPGELFLDEELDSCIGARYAKESQFKGKVMDMSSKGRKFVKRVFMSRIKETNIDELAKLETSNRCKNFFGVLTKWTEGECRYLGRKNQIKAVVKLAAALLSDNDVETSLLDHLNLTTNHVRINTSAKLKKQKKQRAAARKMVPNKERRKASKQTQLEKM